MNESQLSISARSASCFDETLRQAGADLSNGPRLVALKPPGKNL